MLCHAARLLAVIIAFWCGPAAALEPLRVAEGVYAFIGERGDIAPANGGRIGNSGFVVGDTAVAVIDAGVSHAHGVELLAAIRRITDKPVTHLILTHAVQEFIYGTTAFVAAGARPLCHTGSATLMRARCEHCLENLRLILGPEVMTDTRLIVPEETVDGDTLLHVGGRRLQLIHPGWASTPGDLMVLDLASGVLFAGGVVLQGRVPELRDGRLDSWIATIERLPAMGLSVIVPGSGRLLAPQESLETADYLRAVDARVRTMYAAGASLMDAIEDGALPRFAGWDAYESLHRKNTQLHYLALEVEELDRR
jgi:glyoxylase-like metal-dependent hydrolase (beta-lactamase superfamily II)